MLAVLPVQLPGFGELGLTGSLLAKHPQGTQCHACHHPRVVVLKSLSGCQHVQQLSLPSCALTHPCPLRPPTASSSDFPSPVRTYAACAFKSQSKSVQLRTGKAQQHHQALTCTESTPAFLLSPPAESGENPCYIENAEKLKNWCTKQHVLQLTGEIFRLCLVLMLLLLPDATHGRRAHRLVPHLPSPSFTYPDSSQARVRHANSDLETGMVLQHVL